MLADSSGPFLKPKKRGETREAFGKKIAEELRKCGDDVTKDVETNVRKKTAEFLNPLGLTLDTDIGTIRQQV